MYISCGCTKVPQLYKPRKRFGIDPEFFNCTRQIAEFKIIALTPFLMINSFLITLLMALYLQFYTKPILTETQLINDNIIKMEGCFDSQVNADILYLKEEVALHSAANNNINSIFFSVDLTQYALAVICVLNLVILGYTVVKLQALTLLSNFWQLDWLIPSFKVTMKVQKPLQQ